MFLIPTILTMRYGFRGTFAYLVYVLKMIDDV